jgi:serine/threonine protein kinase
MEEFIKVQPKKIKLSDYELARTLGSGSFGRVKLAKNKKDGKYVAIKILKKGELIKLKQVDHILNEIKILSLMDHPFLVKTDGFSQDKKFLYVVLELVNGGELFTYLRGVGKFPPAQAQ